MPTIYLSPSTQEWNPYITGGSEEYYMNLIADAMIPYLRSSGIQYVRNTPQMTAASSIQASNAGNYDLHLALHSNAAPDSLSGQLRGTDVYFDPGNQRSRRAAEIIADNLKDIYPLPDKVRAVPTSTLGEVLRTRAPGVLIEFAYHDNIEDANWITGNIQQIAANVVRSLTEFFNIPFIPPTTPKIGTVRVQSGNLNIRSRPNTGAPVIGRLANGQTVPVLGEWNGWYVVDNDGIVGYTSSQFIDL